MPGLAGKSADEFAPYPFVHGVEVPLLAAGQQRRHVGSESRVVSLPGQVPLEHRAGDVRPVLLHVMGEGLDDAVCCDRLCREG